MLPCRKAEQSLSAGSFNFCRASVLALDNTNWQAGHAGTAQPSPAADAKASALDTPPAFLGSNAQHAVMQQGSPPSPAEMSPESSTKAGLDRAAGAQLSPQAWGQAPADRPPVQSASCSGSLLAHNLSALANHTQPGGSAGMQCDAAAASSLGADWGNGRPVSSADSRDQQREPGSAEPDPDSTAVPSTNSTDQQGEPSSSAPTPAVDAAPSINTRDQQHAPSSSESAPAGNAALLKAVVPQSQTLVGGAAVLDVPVGTAADGQGAAQGDHAAQGREGLPGHVGSKQGYTGDPQGPPGGLPLVALAGSDPAIAELWNVEVREPPSIRRFCSTSACTLLVLE